MQVTHVKGLELPISQVVLGTMTFGDSVDAALDAGVTLVDTANGYAGGASEEILGALLPKRRGSVLLASKAGMPHADAGEDSPLSAAGLRRSVQGSLRRLGVERLDLFYLHQPDRSVPLEETLGAMGVLVQEGTFGALGVSNFAAWQIAELNATADRTGAPRPVVAQQLYNLVARRIEQEYAEFALSSGLHTMVYNPLGGGLLTGKHHFEVKPEGGRFHGSRLAEMYKQRYWDKQLFDAIAELSRIADGAGMPLTELAFRWLLSRPVTGSILLGGYKVGQLRANIKAAAKGPLPEVLVATCDQVGKSLHGPMPIYNR